MAVYICDKNGVKGSYSNNTTKQIIDILIAEGTQSFLVRRLYDESSIGKVSERAFSSSSKDNVILGYCAKFGYPIKMSAENRPLVKIRGNVIRCYPKDRRNFMTENNIDIYRASGIVVLTTETYEDIVRQYASEDIIYTVFDGEMEVVNGTSKKVHKPISKTEFLVLTRANSKTK